MSARVRVVNVTRDTVLAERAELASSHWARFMGLMGRAEVPPGPAWCCGLAGRFICRSCGWRWMWCMWMGGTASRTSCAESSRGASAPSSWAANWRSSSRGGRPRTEVGDEIRLEDVR